MRKFFRDLVADFQLAALAFFNPVAYILLVLICSIFPEDIERGNHDRT